MSFLSRSTPLLVALYAMIAGASYAAQPAPQDYPKRPVRLLVPSPPGGPSDFAGRLIAPRLSEALGQNVVVDNRQSVNGILATELAAKSPPDGNTLVIGNIGTMVMNVGLYKKLPYDPLRDFAPVCQLVSAGTALIANPKFTPKTFKGFVALAKKDPGKINIAVAGANGQVATEVLKFAAGINLNTGRRTRSCARCTAKSCASSTARRSGTSSSRVVTRRSPTRRRSSPHGSSVTSRDTGRSWLRPGFNRNDLR